MHIPVLLDEVIKYLNPVPGENFIDCTVGEGGHTFAVLQRTKPNGKVLALDLSVEAIEHLDKINSEKQKLKNRLILINGNFKDLKKIVKKCKFYPVNGILLDIGLSNWQIEESKRGFSFRKDEPLKMNFNNQGLTAKEIINNSSEKELRDIFSEYGEERYSWKIAKQIIRERKNKSIETTFELKNIIEKIIPHSKTYRGNINRVLARIFQSVRIVVNNELENLKQGLEQSLKILESNGRLVVISFHSLEDRIVKNFFKEEKKKNTLKILTKKPITASEEELKNNPRSRSAKLRAIIKL